MLAALLVAGLVAAALSTLVLLAPLPAAAGRSSGAWPWSRRLVLALIGTGVVTAAAAGVLLLLGATRHNTVLAAASLVVGSLIWLPVTRRWSARGHLCWSNTVFLFVAYLAFMLDWTLNSGLPVASEVGGLMLWALEVFAAFLGTAYLWELCDALGSEALAPPDPQRRPGSRSSTASCRSSACRCRRTTSRRRWSSRR